MVLSRSAMAAFTSPVSRTGCEVLTRLMAAAKPRMFGTRLGLALVMATRSSHGATDRSVASAMMSSTFVKNASWTSTGSAPEVSAVGLAWGCGAEVEGTAGRNVGVGAAVGATVGAGVGAGGGGGAGG